MGGGGDRSGNVGSCTFRKTAPKTNPGNRGFLLATPFHNPKPRPSNLNMAKTTKTMKKSDTATGAAPAPATATVAATKTGLKKAAGTKRKIAPSSTTDAVKRKTRRPQSSFASYTYKVLKQVQRDIGISKKAMSIMNSFVGDVFDQITQEATNLVRKNKKPTMSTRDIQTAVRLVFPGDLAKHAVSEGTKAVTKFEAST